MDRFHPRLHFIFSAWRLLEFGGASSSRAGWQLYRNEAHRADVIPRRCQEPNERSATSDPVLYVHGNYGVRWMNSDTRETAEILAKQARAIISCPICHEHEISVDDPEAERRTYALATQSWQSVSRGFQGMTREDVMNVIRSVLASASPTCPRCSFMSQG